MPAGFRAQLDTQALTATLITQAQLRQIGLAVRQIQKQGLVDKRQMGAIAALAPGVAVKRRGNKPAARTSECGWLNGLGALTGNQ